jgi:peptidylprolyl isomerase
VKLLVLIAVFCASLTLAACGGSDPSNETTKQAAATTAGNEETETTESSGAEGEAPSSTNLLTLNKKEKFSTIKRPNIKPPSTLPTELVIRDRKEGAGPASESGDELTTEYFAVDPSGKMAYSSWDESSPAQYSFELGSGKDFRGWEEGMEGMKVGGRRELLIPASLTRKLGPLFYVVDLLEIRRGDRCWASQALKQAEYGHEHLVGLDCNSRVRVRLNH